MAFLGLSGALSVFITIGIVVALLVPALDFFRQVSLGDFLTGTRWAPTFADKSFGVLPLVTGTLWTTAIGLMVAVPIGLAVAIYLAEYASTRVRKTFKPMLELLAGIPSVVYGYFALSFVAPVFLQRILHVDVGTYSVLSAGLVLGVMIIPTIASLSEDAMSAVPQTLRHGSLALGANKLRTTLRVVFPAAISGIAAAIVLGLSRAVGETMIVALAAGTRADVVTDPTMNGQTMTGFIAQTATG
jgi:phosphate ABC transporter permease protein PstC